MAKKETETKEPGFRDYLGNYNALDKLREGSQKEPYGADLRSTIGDVLGLGEAAFGITPDKLDRELLIRSNGAKSKLVEAIDANLEGIVDSETEGFDIKKTSNLLMYAAANSKPVFANPKEPTQTEMFHAQLYNAQMVQETEKENPKLAREMMKEALSPFYGEMADRLTINQSEVLDTLYGGYVQTATEQFVSSFMGENEEGKAPEYNMDAVKGYLTQIMKGTDAETKIKLANGLVSIKGK
jgi:hypothetical protein